MHAAAAARIDTAQSASRRELQRYMVSEVYCDTELWQTRHRRFRRQLRYA